MTKVACSLLALLLAAVLLAQTGVERLRKIHGLTFPPEQCYRVRDIHLEREDIKLYFSDGYLLFADPIDGRSIAALFLAATDTGEGDVIVMPPTVRERQSMAGFLGEPVLSENMRTALMFFTDDTADVLRRAMAENPFNRPDPETGQKLAPDWQSIARNIVPAYQARLLIDSMVPRDSEVPALRGFFAAAISGSKLGRFDILVDPRRSEQVSAGQVVWREGQRFYDIWTSFAARSTRGDRKATLAPDPGSIENYRIEAEILPELDMKVTARGTFVGGALPERAIPFELSSELRVSQVLWGGRPVEFLQNEALDSSGVRRRGNNVVLIVLDEPPASGSRHEMEFQYQGNVITDAGHGVYFVGARGNWYPSRGFRFANFDLTFHYPRRLQLVATGRLLESGVEADTRTSHYRPDMPIRVAGFNLGNFERTSLRVGDCTVEVCANRSLEAALQPPVLVPLIPPAGPPRRLQRGPGLTPQETPTPEPSRRIDELARGSSETLSFFIERFGPPPLKHLIISPIPGRFGQGFPGLVYLSTLGYYQAQDKPLEKLTTTERLFFTEQLRAHEIAHQWWGNLVSTSEYRDEWLMEALADYSALLFLERHKGPRVLDSMLATYKNNLLAKTESGETVESAGAIVLGERLRSSKSPQGHHVITYQKGTWVIHMLRRLLGDQKFFAMLGDLRRRYEYKTVSTEDFRELAAGLVPRNSPDPKLETFFSQWVYATGIPKLELRYKIIGKAPQLRLAGVVKQSGVPEDFSVSVPIEIQAPGRSDRGETRVQTSGGETEFSVALASRPTRVALDPKESVLAIKP